MKRLELGVGGMSCAACSARVERALKDIGEYLQYLKNAKISGNI